MGSKFDFSIKCRYMTYRIYGFLHRTAKGIIHRNTSEAAYRMISVTDKNLCTEACVELDGEIVGDYINDMMPVPEVLKKSDVFPVENIVGTGTFASFSNSYSYKRKCNEKLLGTNETEAEALWMEFIRNSEIPEGYRNEFLHCAGYIWECEEWCLPSWIWTNAALVRMYCSIGRIDEARIIGDRLIALQQECGGWIVRNDYDSEGAIPVLAPNDSAYMANNSGLELYLATKEDKYLKSAVKCAEWIIDTVGEDGMVFVGYDMKHNCWHTEYNIVDVGFTAGLFARLYEITNDVRYFSFLKRFTERYIELFYIPSKNGFTASLDENGNRIGGIFSRGQAWALEGLIPASRVLHNETVTSVVQETINNLLKFQDKQGGWAYNLSRPFMGIDCKAASVIACSLMNWYKEHPDQIEIKNAAGKAYKWCISHTLPDGKGRGGIYSYSTEGAVVHHHYSCTAFVYGSSYAVELKRLLSEDKI